MTSSLSHAGPVAIVSGHVLDPIRSQVRSPRLRDGPSRQVPGPRSKLLPGQGILSLLLVLVQLAKHLICCREQPVVKVPLHSDRRCIPPAYVASRSNTAGIFPRRALPVGRIAGLGATQHFHHGLLAGRHRQEGHAHRTRFAGAARRALPVVQLLTANRIDPPALSRFRSSKQLRTRILGRQGLLLASG